MLKFTHESDWSKYAQPQNTILENNQLLQNLFQACFKYFIQEWFFRPLFVTLKSVFVIPMIFLTFFVTIINTHTSNATLQFTTIITTIGTGLVFKTIAQFIYVLVPIVIIQ